MSRGSIDEWDLDDLAIGSGSNHNRYNMPESTKRYDVNANLQRRLSDSAIRPGSPARYSFYGSMTDFVERGPTSPPQPQPVPVRHTLAAEAWTTPAPVKKEKEEKKEKEKEEAQKSQGSLGYSFGDEEDDVMNWALGVYQSVRVPSRNLTSAQKRPNSVNSARLSAKNRGAAETAKNGAANGSTAYYSIEDDMTDSRPRRSDAPRRGEVLSRQAPSQNVAVVPGPDEVAATQQLPLMAAEVSWDSMPLILEGTPGSDAASLETVEMYKENRILTLAVAAQDAKEVTLPEPLYLDPRRGADTDNVALHPVQPVREEVPLQISTTRENKTYLSDEAFMIDYERSKVSQMSAVLDMLRLHCLTGHNTTLVVGNTQRCTSLAEQCVVSELVRSVDEIVHSDEVFGNVMTVTAYAIKLDGTVYNLLPTCVDDSQAQLARLGKNPLFGVCIGNGAPIRVCDSNDAKYVAQTVQYNARGLEVDPYANADTMVSVQLVLKQTRKVKGSFGDGYPPEVFLSSFQILHVGSNYQVLYKAIKETPKEIWPLLESAFEGHCRTSFVGFMDQEDDQSDVKRTMEFVDFMRGITNKAPFSGSVRKFLRKAANATDINQELRVPLTAKSVCADAQRLLADASVEPAVYPLSTKQQWTPVPTRQHDAVLFVSRKVQPGGPKRSESPAAHTQPLSVHIPRPPSVAIARGNTDVYVRMPVAVMVREQNANLMEKVRQTLQHSSLVSKERQPTLRVTSSTRRPNSTSADGAGAGANDSSNYVRGIGKNGSSKPVSGKVVTKVSSTTAAAAAAADAAANNSSSKDGGGAGEGINGLAARLMKHAEESHEENTAPVEDDALHIKSTVLLLHPHGQAPKTGPDAMSLAMVDETSIFLTLPEEAAALAGASKCRFIVDEVRQVSAPEEANQLVQTFSSLRRLRDSFLYDQSNVVLLSAHFDAPGSPFVAQPMWSDYKETITELAALKSRRKEPTQITLFGGLLKGKTLMQDLAEAGMEDSDFEPRPCVVGASPLFGPVLNQARGVDVAGPGEVDAVIDSMLLFADDVAGSDDNMWIVLTCVQKTTYALDVNHLSIEAAKRGYLYDVVFSSFTVVCTRNTAQTFADAFNKDDSRYPISILRTAMGGPAQTTCLLSIEANHSNATTVLQGLLAQYKVCGLTSVKPRSGRVSTYVQDCRNVSHAARSRIMDEELDDAQCALLAERSAKYENMAMEHEIYLRNSDCEGLIIYPITTDDGAATPSTQPSSAVAPANGSPKPNSRPSSRAQSRPGSRSASRVSDGAAPLLSCTINVDASSNGLMSFSPRPPDMASGIASHSLLLLGNIMDVTESRTTMGDDYVDVHATNTAGDVWVESGFSAMQKTFHVDEVVAMNKPGSLPGKTTTIENSEMLRSALSAFLCGSNASVVLQETLEAADAGMSQGLLHYLTKCIMDFRSGDATFYLSAAFAGREGTIDLLKPDVTDRDMKPSEIGFSPLGGAVLREAKLWPQTSEAGAHAAVDRAFAADLALESGEDPHLLIFTMWQQLRIEAENDICLSSFTIVIGRSSGMTISQFFRPDTPYVRLLNYVLAGPCFTVCITAVTNAEPDDGQSPVFKMLNYQTMKLCSLPGKTMKFNSYVDLLKYHKSRAASQKSAWNDMKQQAQKAKGAQAKAELEERVKELENALRVTLSLIEDDKNFLTGKWKGDVAPIYYA